ncbi:MAG: chromate transporter [Peptoniphilaceae bacterium]|nr:chromate transporter [Peptoniphilaceae bacterium]MDY6019448.1 chromate transporter [Anaerococcus sp.]
MLLSLYLSFLKIGLFSFGGGYAALAVIQDEVITNNAWLNLSEFNNLITISQMTPGPIGINAATFVGTKIGGLAGAIFATLGFATPSLIIITGISYLYTKYRNLSVMDNILKFLRPAVVSLLVIAAISIVSTALFGEGAILLKNLDYLMVILIGLSLYLLYKKNYDPVKVMILSGVIYTIISLAFSKI